MIGFWLLCEEGMSEGKGKLGEVEAGIEDGDKVQEVRIISSDGILGQGSHGQRKWE